MIPLIIFHNKKYFLGKNCYFLPEFLLFLILQEALILNSNCAAHKNKEVCCQCRYPLYCMVIHSTIIINNRTMVLFRDVLFIDLLIDKNIHQLLVLVSFISQKQNIYSSFIFTRLMNIHEYTFMNIHTIYYIYSYIY